MTFKKDVYELNEEGEIIKYNMNYDVSRFTFLPKSSALFEKMVDTVNHGYTIDWDDVFDQYLNVGIGDVPHFSAQYVFAKFLLAKRADEKENMEQVYLKLVKVVNDEIEKGNLPGSK